MKGKARSSVIMLPCGARKSRTRVYAAVQLGNQFYALQTQVYQLSSGYTSSSSGAFYSTGESKG